MIHTGVMETYYHPILLKEIRILEYSGVYSIILYGDSAKCIYSKMVNGIIPNSHTDKSVTGNNHWITHSILFSSQFVEIREY
jgi:hypothetical protein